MNDHKPSEDNFKIGVCMCVCVCVCVCAYACVSVCICVCVRESVFILSLYKRSLS